VRILLVSGSLRARSTNTAALRTAAELAPPDVEAVLYDGLAGLPHFNPDDDGDALPASVSEMREAVRAATAVLFSTPEYAGALPGSLLNFLDWTIGDDVRGSIYEKSVAWINVSVRGADLAHESLRTVLGYAHADIVEDACRRVPVTSAHVGEDGLIRDEAVRTELVAAVQALLGNLTTRGDTLSSSRAGGDWLSRQSGGTGL
jgi:NAD(P)H-dependent FMN reductase